MYPQLRVAALGEVRGDGSIGEVVRSGNAVLKLARQWSRLIAGGAGKYLMLGRMLHPPQLRTDTIRYKVSSNKASDLRASLYTLNHDQSATVAHTSCRLTVAREAAWQQYCLDLTIQPPSAELHIPLTLKLKGELLFDDFVLTEVGESENLMHDGGFEDWSDPTTPPPGWTHITAYRDRRYTGTFQREEKDSHSGAYAMRFVNASGKDPVHMKYILPIDGQTLSVGKTYRLSFWAKVHGVSCWQPVSIEREHPAILHNAFRAPDGSEAVIAVNITDQQQTGALTWAGREIPLALSPWEIRLVRE